MSPAMTLPTAIVLVILSGAMAIAMDRDVVSLLCLIFRHKDIIMPSISYEID
jgi:hypothetical protein